MKIKNFLNLICISMFVLFSGFWLQAETGDIALAIDYESPPAMSDYEAMPLAQTRSGTRPKVMILLSNDHTSFYGGYEGRGPYDDGKEYWGYFEPNKIYEYQGDYFYPVDETSANNHKVAHSDYWSGNFLNWLTMAHGDFNRKALTGGKRGHDDASRTRLLRADIPSDGHRWDRTEDDLDGGLDLSDFVPDSIADYIEEDSDHRFINEGTYLKVVDGDISNNDEFDSFEVEVEVCVNGDGENCVEYDKDYKPEGLLQKYMDEIDFALMTYSVDAKVDEGGIVRKNMGDIRGELNQNGTFNQGVDDSMIRYINSYSKKSWDPVGEMYYEALRYFKGLSVTSDYRPSGQSDDNYPFFGDHSQSRSWSDPYEDWCDDVSIVVINDEYPSRDDNYPGINSALGEDEKSLTDEVGDMQGIHGNSYPDRDEVCEEDTNISSLGNVSGLCPATDDIPSDWGEATGTFHVAGLAHYAYTNDLRDDFDEEQKIYTYSIAYRASPSGYLEPEDDMNPLYLAGKYGNLEEVESESDDGDPTGISFFSAEEGNQIWNALDTVFQNVLKRTGSGTAASVLTPSGEGEGSVIQAYFEPELEKGENKVRWAGFLQSLWMDPCGNLREDTNGNNKLDYSEDKIIEYTYDSSEGTRIKRYSEHPDMTGDDESLECGESEDDDYSHKLFGLNEAKTIFEAGEVLWDTEPDDRTIYTYDKTESGEDKKIEFETGGSYIKDLLGVNDSSVDSSYSLEHLDEHEDDRGDTLIEYIRGNDFEGLRNRTIEINDEDGENTWKLGDIVNSTPVTIAGAVENYHLIYSDASYQEYLDAQSGRETMVYVGANDGMLHAFTHGSYNEDTEDDTKGFEKVDGTELGKEVWAYIPRALLPHLKWLADPDYKHVFYADLKPTVFDAKIKDNGNEWGTFLLLGLNKGGKKIYVDDGSTDGQILYPSYTLIDITEPREPEVIWERSYEGLGLTTSEPSVFKVGDKWFAAFGSGLNDEDGKDDYDGRSDQNAKIYVIDLETGDPYGDGNEWLKELSEDNAFLNSPTAFDKNLNYSVDGIYFGESYVKPHNDPAKEYWEGNIHKLTVPWDEGELSRDYYDNPNDWNHSVLFNSPGPVTAPVNMRTDPDDNVLVFFGTGKYLGHDDSLDENQQFLFGIKDPFYDRSDDTHYQEFNLSKTLEFDSADLFYANPIDVTDQGYVYDESGLFTDAGEDGIWEEFVPWVRENHDGWYRELEKPEYGPSERIISEPSLIGGTLLVPSFIPTDDVCGFDGESNVYALYYQTGTGFRDHVLSKDESPGSRYHPEEGDQDITAVKFKEKIIGAPAGELAFPGRAGKRVPVLLTMSTAEMRRFITEPDRQISRITGWRDK